MGNLVVRVPADRCAVLRIHGASAEETGATWRRPDQPGGHLIRERFRLKDRSRRAAAHRKITATGVDALPIVLQSGCRRWHQPTYRYGQIPPAGT